jgi:hypothetical protein
MGSNAIASANAIAVGDTVRLIKTTTAREKNIIETRDLEAHPTYGSLGKVENTLEPEHLLIKFYNGVRVCLNIECFERFSRFAKEDRVTYARYPSAEMFQGCPNSSEEADDFKNGAQKNGLTIGMRVNVQCVSGGNIDFLTVWFSGGKNYFALPAACFDKCG